MLDNLSSGEKTALASGKDILTESQLAVCYLCADARVMEREVSFGSGIGSDISVECGLNPESFRRTCNKFELILQDRHEDEEFTSSEAIYPKILAAYAKFAEMRRSELLDLAHQAFTEDNKKVGQALKDAHSGKLKKYAQVKKQLDEKLKFKLMDVYNGLKRAGINGEKAKEMAISKVCKEDEKERSEVLRIWNLVHKC